MKETGIIMSGNHPKLILDLLKTMTRKVIKPQPHGDVWFSGKDFHLCTMPKSCALILSHCPYGQVGERLWVRETFVLECDQEYGYTMEELERWKKDRPIKTEDGGFDWGEYHLIPHYRSTELEPNIVPEYVDDFDNKTRWSPSIFMPRWASRITLEITEVRAERLQEITAGDCTKEGIPYEDGDYVTMKVFDKFRKLWDSLNAKRGYGWDFNPWVWAISFKKV